MPFPIKFTQNIFPQFNPPHPQPNPKLLWLQCKIIEEQSSPLIKTLIIYNLMGIVGKDDYLMNL